MAGVWKTLPNELHEGYPYGNYYHWSNVPLVSLQDIKEVKITVGYKHFEDEVWRFSIPPEELQPSGSISYSQVDPPEILQLDNSFFTMDHRLFNPIETTKKRKIEDENLLLQTKKNKKE